jgi:hypothetical protein
MHSQDLSKIDILRWGARATGINIDWCLTPGIPHGVHDPGKFGRQKSTQREYCL